MRLFAGYEEVKLWEKIKVGQEIDFVNRKLELFIARRCKTHPLVLRPA